MGSCHARCVGRARDRTVRSVAWVASSFAGTPHRRARPPQSAACCPRQAPGHSRPAARCSSYCSGQATASPCTMPWLSGPPLCGQRSSRQTPCPRPCGTAISSPRGAPPARAQHRDVVHAANEVHSLIFLSPQATVSGANWRVSTALPWPFQTGVGLAIERELQLFPQRLAAFVVVRMRFFT